MPDPSTIISEVFVAVGSSVSCAYILGSNLGAAAAVGCIAVVTTTISDPAAAVSVAVGAGAVGAVAGPAGAVAGAVAGAAGSFIGKAIASCVSGGRN